MSDHDPANDEPAEIDLTAAEYVLGLSDAAARARAVTRIGADRVFSATVAEWEARFAPWLDAVASVSPPDALWDRIAHAMAAPSNLVRLSAKPHAFNTVGFWRVAAGGAIAAAAVFLAIIVLRPAPPPIPPSTAKREIMVATLAAPDAKSLFVATYDQERGDVTVVPVKAAEPGARAPELWIIRSGEKPRAVGMLAAARARTVALATLGSPRWRAGDVLAVSLEPPGGSTTGAPTGPVVATGALTAL